MKYLIERFVCSTNEYATKIERRSSSKYITVRNFMRRSALMWSSSRVIVDIKTRGARFETPLSKTSMRRNSEDETLQSILEERS